jgi:hypothetical protein
MDTTETTEYELHLFHYSGNGTERWKAVVDALPQISAEGPTCEAVLEEIGEKLHSSLADPRNTAAPLAEPRSHAVGTPPSELPDLEARLKAMGHSGYGIFADDPGALDVFDEIEQLRDQHTIGGG